VLSLWIASWLAASSPVIAATFHGLGRFPNGGTVASAVSRDGNVAVGARLGESNSTEAIRWQEIIGLEQLGNLPSNEFHSDALGVSADGTVVVGNSSALPDHYAYRWQTETGIFPLLPLPGLPAFSECYGVSADGRVTVGWNLARTGERISVRWVGDEVEPLGDLPGGDEFS
jgi:uncharacterized membrane protein